MKKYSSNRAGKGKTAYRTSSGFKVRASQFNHYRLWRNDKPKFSQSVDRLLSRRPDSTSNFSKNSNRYDLSWASQSNSY